MCMWRGCSYYSHQTEYISFHTTTARQHSDLTVAALERQIAGLKERLQQQHDKGLGSRNEVQRLDASPGGAAVAQEQQLTHQQQAAGTRSSSSTTAEDSGPAGPSTCTSLVLATTDVCLKVVPKELLPIGLPLLIQYDIPPTKVCCCAQ